MLPTSPRRGKVRRSNGPVLLAVVAVIALSGVEGSAAGLQLTSGGIVLAERGYGLPTDCMLAAVSDTHVRRDQPGSSFGSAQTLLVNNSSASTSRALLRFDTGQCDPAIPADAIIHSATLSLTTSSLLSGASRSYLLWRATAAWGESTTWAGQPTVATASTSSATVPLGTLAGTAVGWSVVGDVQAFVAGDLANHGWRLSDAVEDGTLLLSAQLAFHSREAASLSPQLTITYAP